MRVTIPYRIASAMFGMAVFCAAVVPASAGFEAVRASFGIRDEALGSVFHGYAYLRSGKIYLTHDSAYEAKPGRGNSVGIEQSGGEGCRDFSFDSHGDPRTGRQCFRVKQTGPGLWQIHADNQWTDTWPNGGKYMRHTTVDVTLALIKADPRSRCTLSGIKGEESYSTPHVQHRRAAVAANAKSTCHVTDRMPDWQIKAEDGAFMQ